jgi:ribosome-binding protein aMBF1 (putative translation factor)
VRVSDETELRGARLARRALQRRRRHRRRAHGQMPRSVDMFTFDNHSSLAHRVRRAREEDDDSIENLAKYIEPPEMLTTTWHKAAGTYSFDPRIS